MYKNEMEISLLLISPIPPPLGGIATWTKSFIDMTKKYEININVVNTSLIGARLKNINTKRNMIEEFKRTKKIFNGINDLILNMKKNQEINVAHINTSCGYFGVIRDYYILKKLKKNDVPTVVHYHCNIEDQIKKRPLQKFYLKKMSKIANRNFVLNSSSRDYLNKNSGINSEIVNNFISSNYILKENKVIKNEIEKIIFVGHVRISKGIKEIIQVAKEFPNIEFLVVGPLSDEININLCQKNIKFMGDTPPEKIADLLEQSDAFILPSFSEGFSLSLLEAMAKGLPIITTDVGANKDMVEDEGGIIVGTRNAEDIKAAIDIISSPILREKMSVWNVNKVKNEYQADFVTENIINIYREELSRSNLNK